MMAERTTKGQLLQQARWAQQHALQRPTTDIDGKIADLVNAREFCRRAGIKYVLIEHRTLFRGHYRRHRRSGKDRAFAAYCAEGDMEAADAHTNNKPEAA